MHVLKTRLKVSLSFVLLATAGFFLTGCPSGSDLEDEDRFPGNSGGSGASGGSGGSGGSGSCEQCDVQASLKEACTNDGCHGSNVYGGGLDLVSPGVEQRLIDQAAWTMRATEVSDPDSCDLTEKRVDSADPARSVLIHKLLGTQSCGQNMPAPPYKFKDDANADIQCLTRWTYCMVGKDPATAAGGSGSGGSGSGGSGTGGTGSGGTAGSGGTGSGGTGSGGTGSGGTGSGGTAGSGGSTGGSGGSGGSGT
jgi:hypothetical protein